MARSGRCTKRGKNPAVTGSLHHYSNRATLCIINGFSEAAFGLVGGALLAEECYLQLAYSDLLLLLRLKAIYKYNYQSRHY